GRGGFGSAGAFADDHRRHARRLSHRVRSVRARANDNAGDCGDARHPLRDRCFASAESARALYDLRRPRPHERSFAMSAMRPLIEEGLDPELTDLLGSADDDHDLTSPAREARMLAAMESAVRDASETAPHHGSTPSKVRRIVKWVLPLIGLVP